MKGPGKQASCRTVFTPCHSVSSTEWEMRGGVAWSPSDVCGVWSVDETPTPDRKHPSVAPLEAVGHAPIPPSRPVKAQPFFEHHYCSRAGEARCLPPSGLSLARLLLLRATDTSSCSCARAGFLDASTYGVEREGKPKRKKRRTQKPTDNTRSNSPCSNAPAQPSSHSIRFQRVRAGGEDPTVVPVFHHPIISTLGRSFPNPRVLVNAASVDEADSLGIPSTPEEMSKMGGMGRGARWIAVPGSCLHLGAILLQRCGVDLRHTQ